MPRDLAVLGKLAVMGVFYVAVPFTLITWAEQSIDSALATILQGLTPLFALVIAAIVLHDEPITINKVGGLQLGFAGAAVIVARHLAPTAGANPGAELTGELALVLSCLSYAAGATFLRRTIGTRKLVLDPITGPRALRPVEIALPQNIVAPAVIAVPAVLFESGTGGSVPPSAAAWLSVVWLGLFGSALAYLLFFRLLNIWGVYRSSLITYVMPIIGIILGVVVLNELIDLQTMIGAVMVIGGVALANAPIGRRQLYGRAAKPTPEPAVAAATSPSATAD